MKKIFIAALIGTAAAVSLVAESRSAEPQNRKAKPALLVIDVQNCYLNTIMSPEDTTLALPRIAWAVKLFRSAGLPVIRIYHDDVGQAPEPGDADFEFPSHLGVLESDPKIVKHYGDAFYETDLAKILKDHGCNTVFLCGLSATGCVLATHFGTYENHFNSFMIEDALISPNAEWTNNIEKMFKTINLSALKFVIENICD
ncbi:isochorismatase family protein [bacterium]|nr:isochorismatase family protein [bacterium]